MRTTRRHHRWTVALLALAVALSLPLAAQASSPAGASPAKWVRKVALGVSQNPDFGLAALDAFTASVGRRPAIWSVWSAWGGANAEFPTELARGMRARGVVPQVFWEPVDPSIPPQQDDPSGRYAYSRIVAGDHDEYIRRWARDAKAVGGPVLLKFAHEMNAPWFPWGIGRAGNTPYRFRKAWRHIHDLIRGPGGEGATNVKMVWSFYSGCACVDVRTLYPGDRFVEYTGFSSFDWGGTRTMQQLFADGVQVISQRTRKPIIVTETGTPADATRKAEWITTGYPEVYKAYPAIKAIVYFDVEVTGQPDWRLTSPENARAAYAGLLAKRKFKGRIR